MRSTELQHLLLDLLSTHRPVNPAVVERLDRDAWDEISTMVDHHRLGAMLHWRLRNEHTGLPVPQDLAEKLADDFKRSVLRSLVMQREIIRIHRVLRETGLDHAFLKGAFLAFHSYPNSGLRPLRDIDLLVPKAKALTAYQALQDAGYGLLRDRRGDLEELLELAKHLPPLISPSGGIKIELHVKLITTFGTGGEEMDLAREPQLWQRLTHRETAGETIPFLSVTDMLLHVIEHAVYDHAFDNGPLTFADVAYTLERHPIDWALFWRLADYTGRTRGCLLLLRMTERYWGPQPIEWPEGPAQGPRPDEDLMANASALTLTLRGCEVRRTVKLKTKMAGEATLSGKAGALLSEIFPPREVLSAQFPVKKDSPFIHLWHLVRWYRMLTRRVPKYLAARRSSGSQQELQDLAACKRWLAGEETK